MSASTPISSQIAELKEEIAKLAASVASLTSTADKVFDTKGASEFTGMAVSTLETLRNRGGGPAYFKIGKSVRYKASDLVVWLDRPRQHSTAEQAHA